MLWNWKESKYLIAYLVPLAGFTGLYFGGWASLGTVYIGFVLIPLLEQWIPMDTSNFDERQEAERKRSRFFDWLLYLNLPFLYLLIIYYFIRIQAGGLTNFEVVGMTLNVGLAVGTIGINVAHELGHRSTWHEQLMSKTLLLTALYMHFFIEHNRGHHKNVATDEDPASARFGETLYAFWWRSVTGSYQSAWALEAERLKRAGKANLSLDNQMLIFQLIQVAYLVTIGLIFSWAMVPYAIAIAISGFLLLETVNYIEHYGLRRKKLPSGRYELVREYHSWNSDHELGRIFLYELTRHSDHHYKANRKYQVLRHFDESPQLPYGYPASMLLSLVPPLWFSKMNKRVRDYQAVMA
ncbi:MAG: alkane 1-monooxygenase [Bacteroidota bacterium]